LIPVADLVIRQVASQKGWLPRIVFTALLLIGVSMKIWETRNYQVSHDYHDEITYWRNLGELIGHDKDIIQLSGDYGYRLAYFGWVRGSFWSTNADQALFTLRKHLPILPANYIRNSRERSICDHLPPEWEAQPELRDYLTTHYH
jgi:hypothetical protein